MNKNVTIMNIMFEHPEISVVDLAKELKISRTSTYTLLYKLEKQGVISLRREGNGKSNDKIFASLNKKFVLNGENSEHSMLKSWSEASNNAIIDAQERIRDQENCFKNELDDKKVFSGLFSKPILSHMIKDDFNIGLLIEDENQLNSLFKIITSSYSKGFITNINELITDYDKKIKKDKLAFLLKDTLKSLDKDFSYSVVFKENDDGGTGVSIFLNERIKNENKTKKDIA